MKISQIIRVLAVVWVAGYSFSCLPNRSSLLNSEDPVSGELLSSSQVGLELAKLLKDKNIETRSVDHAPMAKAIWDKLSQILEEYNKVEGGYKNIAAVQVQTTYRPPHASPLALSMNKMGPSWKFILDIYPANLFAPEKNYNFLEMMKNVSLVVEKSVSLQARMEQWGSVTLDLDLDFAREKNLIEEGTFAAWNTKIDAFAQVLLLIKPHVPQDMNVGLHLHLNSHALYKRGHFFEHSFVEEGPTSLVMKNSGTLHVDLAQLESVASATAKIPALLQAQKQLEDAANVPDAPMKVHFWMGKKEVNLAELNALVTSPDFKQKIAQLAKQTTVQNLFWVQNFDDVSPSVVIGRNFLSLDWRFLSDKKNWGDLAGGFIALSPSVNPRKGKIAVSIPASALNYEISAIDQDNKILSKSSPSINRYFPGSDRVELLTADEMDFGEGLEFSLRVRHNDSRIIRQLVKIKKK